MTIQRIEQELTEINNHIEAEKKLLNATQNYRDCELKTMVVHQCQGAIRGLEVGREKLLFIRELLQTNEAGQTTIEDFGIDNRGGLVRYGN